MKFILYRYQWNTSRVKSDQYFRVFMSEKTIVEKVKKRLFNRQCHDGKMFTST